MGIAVSLTVYLTAYLAVYSAGAIATAAPEAAGTFAKTSLDWQVQRSLQQVGEWIEWVLFGESPNRPNFSGWMPPEWVLQALFWGIVGLLGIWAAWWLVQWLRPYWEAFQRQQGRAIAPTPPAPAPELSTAEWLARSQAAQRQGDYREACRALYHAALHRLSERHQISPLPSRTDGEYLNLLNALPNAQPYEVLIRTHERLCFSPTPVSAAAFEQCERAYREISTSQ
ncbi:DUF4129 domain-containing protein [Thermoleptolyngbya sichuanensis XZ-Cy5]|uniref:DUF4129 domain-containing protein n=1 Tax=Thermoleptolyngbya sichuanensis TaxID=2885951 RepID=UPI00240D484F|nr:DUF4129 domain-containing protein [Thermoleptolyngbya sichuanensis]MDG2616370.1 DUF4129 domain-containing protein [Thermoleptolyngbya sichuanensis XZ-Cy5]